MNLGSSSFVGIRPLATACLESLPVELLHLIVDRVAHLDYVDNQIRGCAIRTLQSQDHETEGSIPPYATAITRLCLVNSTFAAICQPFIWTSIELNATRTLRSYALFIDQILPRKKKYIESFSVPEIQCLGNREEALEALASEPDSAVHQTRTIISSISDQDRLQDVSYALNAYIIGIIAPQLWHLELVGQLVEPGFDPSAGYIPQERMLEAAKEAVNVELFKFNKVVDDDSVEDRALMDRQTSMTWLTGIFPFFTQLKALTLDLGDQVSLVNDEDDFYDAVAELKSLIILHLHGTRIVHDRWANRQWRSSLTSLSLADSDRLTLDGLARLVSRFPDSLYRLDLSDALQESRDLPTSIAPSKTALLLPRLQHVVLTRQDDSLELEFILEALKSCSLVMMEIGRCEGMTMDMLAQCICDHASTLKFVNLEYEHLFTDDEVTELISNSKGKEYMVYCLRSARMSTYSSIAPADRVPSSQSEVPRE